MLQWRVAFDGQKSVVLSRTARRSAEKLGPWIPPKNYLQVERSACAYTLNSLDNTTFAMSDTEMDGGVALNVASPTHSQLADKINGGAMDMSTLR